MGGCFEKNSEDYAEVEKVVQTLVYNRNKAAFDAAEAKYRELAAKAANAYASSKNKNKTTANESQKEQDGENESKTKKAAEKATADRMKTEILDYFDNTLEYKEKWAGTYARSHYFLGVRTTQRAEGTHWRIKDTIQTTGSLMRTVNSIDDIIRRTMEVEKQDFFSELYKRPIFDDNEHAAMAELFGKVSFFAINMVNYKLPCQHMLPLIGNGTIGIHLIPQRWYLNYAEDYFPANTSTIVGEIRQNTLTTLQRIQDAVENAESNFKKIEIIETINSALDSLKETPVEEVKLLHITKKKGRSETTTGKMIESSFETEEKQIRKDSRKNNTSSGETYDNNLFDSNVYILPGKRDREDKFLESIEYK
ncbi:hypothetical protein EC973_006927, partial [Apophysomyces ossiformis]